MIYWLHTKILIYFYLAEWTNLLRVSAFIPIIGKYALKMVIGKGAKFCQRGYELVGSLTNFSTTITIAIFEALMSIIGMTGESP
jgi:hypothetical protein